MNSILHTSSALFAGAFLNLGLVRLAEWLDPLSNSADAVLSSEMNAAVACATCTVPSEFSAVC